MEDDGRLAGISDKELMGLAIGSVAGFPAHAEAVLVNGVDNMNAMWWVARGKTRRKFARRLMSTFFIMARQAWCRSSGFYLRTNRNVAAYEITRLEETGLTTRGAKKRLTRATLPEQWEAPSRCIPHLDWERVRKERGTLELTEGIIAFLHGKVAEWNSSDYTVTGILEGLGIKTRPVDFRFGQFTSQLQRWAVCGETAQRPLILFGTSHTGHEVRDFHHQLETTHHPIGVSVTPSELAELGINGPLWTQHCWVDSAAIGDVRGGRWNVFSCTRKPMALSTVGYAAGMTLAAKYADIYEEAAAGPPGAVRKYAIPYSIGTAQEILATDQGGRFRILSRNSQLSAQSFSRRVATRNIYWPARLKTRAQQNLAEQISHMEAMEIPSRH